MDAETGRVREGEREEKRRKRGRCGGSFEEGRGKRFGVEPVRKKLTLTHSHSFVHADSVCPIDSSDETAPHSDNAHTRTHYAADCSMLIDQNRYDCDYIKLRLLLDVIGWRQIRVVCFSLSLTLMSEVGLVVG